MADYPQATQKLSASNTVQRFAICPTHNRKSSKFLGVQLPLENSERRMWRFKCMDGTTGQVKNQGHTFLAIPDRSAPKEEGQVEFWNNEQKLNRIGESQKKWQ